MPLIMDNSTFETGLDPMDQLFVEADVQLQPNLSFGLDESGLPQKLDSWIANSCCQTLCWSKFGPIASVNRDRRSVDVIALMYDAKMMQHRLWSPVTLQPPVFADGKDPDGCVTHITWSANGLDLAIVTSDGTVSIFSIYVSVNNLRPVALFSSVHSSLFHYIIAFEWLPINRQTSVCQASANVNGVWVCKSQEGGVTGPSHPIMGKQAFVTLSTLGRLRLTFSKVDNTWVELDSTLDIPDTSGNCLSHATFVTDDGDFLVATLDYHQFFRLYRISIDWRLPANSKQMPPTSVQLNPAINVKRLLVADHPFLGKLLESNVPLSSLCHLRLLPQSKLGEQSHGLAVLCVFCTGEVSLMDMTPNGPTSLAMVFEISDLPQKLSSGFEQFTKRKTKAAANASQSLPTLTCSATAEIPGTVVDVNFFPASTNVVFSLDSGAVETRSRSSLQPVPTGAVNNIYPSLTSAGYHFSASGRFHSVALSPNNCVQAIKNDVDGVKLRSISHPVLSEHLDETISDTTKDSALGGLALMFSGSFGQHHNDADVFIVMQRLSQKVPIAQLLDVLYTSIGLNVDCLNSAEKGEDRILKMLVSVQVARCLSMQHALQWPNGTPNISSKAAWILLHLRTMFTATRLAFSSIQLNSPASLVALADIALSLHGQIRWFLELTAWLIDQLATLSRKCKDLVDDEGIQQQINAMSTPCISMLLASFPRSYLRYICRSIRTLEQRALQVSKSVSNIPVAEPSNASAATDSSNKATTSGAANATAPPKPTLNTIQALAAEKWSRVLSLIEATPFGITRFEQFIAEIDHHAKAAYEKDGKPDDAARVAAERRFLITGEIPTELLPLAKRLVGPVLDKFLDDERTDPMKIFCGTSRDPLNSMYPSSHDAAPTTNGEEEDGGDYLITAPAAAKEADDTDDVTQSLRQLGMTDVIRKIPIPGLSRWRRCTRCYATMEDLRGGPATGSNAGKNTSAPTGAATATLSQNASPLNVWTANLQKGCICGSPWLLAGST